jgi:hypothetical protein
MESGVGALARATPPLGEVVPAAGLPPLRPFVAESPLTDLRRPAGDAVTGAVRRLGTLPEPTCGEESSQALATAAQVLGDGGLLGEGTTEVVLAAVTQAEPAVAAAVGDLLGEGTTEVVLAAVTQATSGHFTTLGRTTYASPLRREAAALVEGTTLAEAVFTIIALMLLAILLLGGVAAWFY